MSLALAAPADTHPPAVAASAPLAVRISNLSKGFAGRQILSGIDLSVERGGALALIGANGTGKSTLLRMLVRLIEPDDGKIEMLDETVTALGPKPLRAFRRRVGIVFQRHNLVGRLSALSNVVHGVQARQSGVRTWLHSLAPEAVRRQAMECLAAVGLADRALQRSDSLSGGQSQRVAIARMLMQRPELVLADEPDASLDPRSGEEVMDLLYRTTKDNGLTLIVISHRLEHTVRYSDRIVGLADRRISLDLPSRSADPRALREFFAAQDHNA